MEENSTILSQTVWSLCILKGFSSGFVFVSGRGKGGENVKWALRGYIDRVITEGWIIYLAIQPFSASLTAVYFNYSTFSIDIIFSLYLTIMKIFGGRMHGVGSDGRSIDHKGAQKSILQKKVD